jgi:hypothetical protein
MFKYLKLKTVNQAIPFIAAENVSEVARSRRGFIRAYRMVNGNSKRLKQTLVPGRQLTWDERRENFIRRHLAQARSNNEPFWRDGFPTRRHLALVAWAYSPTPSKLRRYVTGNNG